jgi:hypothetical protein
MFSSIPNVCSSLNVRGKFHTSTKIYKNYVLG